MQEAACVLNSSKGGYLGTVAKGGFQGFFRGMACQPPTLECADIKQLGGSWLLRLYTAV